MTSYQGHGPSAVTSTLGQLLRDKLDADKAAPYVNLSATRFLEDEDAAKEYVRRRMDDAIALGHELNRGFKVTIAPIRAYDMHRTGWPEREICMAVSLYQSQVSLCYTVTETGRRAWNIYADGEYHDIDSEAQAVAFILARWW